MVVIPQGAGHAECPEDAEEDFAGASGAARNLHVPDPTYACDFCSELFPYLSDIASCEVDGNTVRIHQRSDVERTRKELEGKIPTSVIPAVQDI